MVQAETPHGVCSALPTWCVKALSPEFCQPRTRRVASQAASRARMPACSAPESVYRGRSSPNCSAADPPSQRLQCDAGSTVCPSSRLPVRLSSPVRQQSPPKRADRQRSEVTLPDCRVRSGLEQCRSFLQRVRDRSVPTTTPARIWPSSIIEAICRTPFSRPRHALLTS